MLNASPALESDASAAGSLARTVASTIADGVVHTIAHWKVILLGQFISLTLAIAGGTNDVLALECGVNAPSAYNALGYFLIAIFGGILLVKDTRKDRHDGDKATCEEQEIFSGNRRDGGGEEGDHAVHFDADDDDDDDDLTLDDESTKKPMFTLQRKHIRRTNSRLSHGSKFRSRPKYSYPFLCGLMTIHAKWYFYFALALIEAQAYYLIFLAFRYTSFTFVYVSSAFSIPSAMLFTKLFMRRSYLWTHIIGGAICIVGIVVNTASDMSMESGLEHVKGDIFAICGAILLGLDDVLSEKILSHSGGATEMIFMKGFFGALISVVQLIIFERESVLALFSRGGSCDLSWRMVLLVAHVVARALDVAGEMQFLYLSEAALLNLLLLTSDLIAAIFDFVTIGLTLTPLFYIAFLCIMSGIVIYEAGPSPAMQPTGTPLSIEFHQSEKTHEQEMVVTSSTITEHAGNLSHNGIDGHLT